MTLEELFAKTLEVPADTVSDDTKQSASGVWTSLQHVRLVSALEGAYGVTFGPHEIVRMRTLGHIRKILRAKGVAV